jgi:hypothetical protein
MDVKTTFMNGLIEEEVYIEHPLGFEVHGRESHVCRLKKALYGQYVCDILSRFQMLYSRPMTTPMISNWKKIHASKPQLVDSTLYHQLIRSLMYLVNTRPGICFVVNTLSQFMVETRRVHWVSAKHVLKYLCGMVYYGLEYQRGYGVRLIGYTNSDWAGCVSDRKST